jgi:hypothetical protein
VIVDDVEIGNDAENALLLFGLDLLGGHLPENPREEAPLCASMCFNELTLKRFVFRIRLNRAFENDSRARNGVVVHIGYRAHNNSGLRHGHIRQQSRLLLSPEAIDPQRQTTSA